MVFGTHAWDALSKKDAISIERNGEEDARNVEYICHPKLGPLRLKIVEKIYETSNTLSMKLKAKICPGQVKSRKVSAA